jgi:septum formation protein
LKNIILASRSPRRKQLLEEANISFSVKTAHTDENFPEEMQPANIPAFISTNKAQAVWELLSDAEKAESILLAADTIVIFENEIIGKPQDAAHALSILKKLSGKKHEVLTGVALHAAEQQLTFTERTEVHFRELEEKQMIYYIEEYKPFDKAGAYAIQEWIGLVGIRKINGDFYNVMGLPISRVVEVLKSFS